MKKCGKYYFKMLNILTMLLLMFFLRIEVNTINLKQHTMRPRGEKMLTCLCGSLKQHIGLKKCKGQLSWAVLGCLLGFYWIIDIHANYLPEGRQEPPSSPFCAVDGTCTQCEHVRPHARLASPAREARHISKISYKRDEINFIQEKSGSHGF